MMHSGWLALTVGLALGGSALVVQGQAQRRPPIRFQEMDRNNDGVISAREWSGSPGSFKLHDWNKDGVLSGDEVVLNARGRGRGRGQVTDDDDFHSPNMEHEFADWSAEGFQALDHNGDNRLTADEWHFDRESFRRADHNRDNVISRAEFLSEDDEDDDRGDNFRDLDRNNDGRVSDEEWHGSRAVFKALDNNGDGYVTRVEMTGEEPPANLFTSVDINRDGRISAQEWHWSRAAFGRLDTNRDGQLTDDEFQGRATPVTRSTAYRTGYERGIAEGRTAGREDRDRNQGWDLEGQRELETADSGYQPSVGPKAEFQAGYRDAFRMAYREGWDRR